MEADQLLPLLKGDSGPDARNDTSWRPGWWIEELDFPGYARIESILSVIRGHIRRKVMLVYGQIFKRQLFEATEGYQGYNGYKGYNKAKNHRGCNKACKGFRKNGPVGRHISWAVVKMRKVLEAQINFPPTYKFDKYSVQGSVKRHFRRICETMGRMWQNSVPSPCFLCRFGRRFKAHSLIQIMQSKFKKGTPFSKETHFFKIRLLDQVSNL